MAALAGALNAPDNLGKPVQSTHLLCERGLGILRSIFDLLPRTISNFTALAGAFKAPDSLRSLYPCLPVTWLHPRRGTQGLMDGSRSSIFRATYSGDPIGVPRTVMPSGCQASGPKFTTFSGAMPAWFHVFVLPWRSWMPA